MNARRQNIQKHYKLGFANLKLTAWERKMWLVGEADTSNEVAIGEVADDSNFNM